MDTNDARECGNIHVLSLHRFSQSEWIGVEQADVGEVVRELIAHDECFLLRGGTKKCFEGTRCGVFAVAISFFETNGE